MNDLHIAGPGPLSLLEIVGLIALAIWAARLIVFLDRWLTIIIENRTQARRGPRPPI